MTPEPKFLRRFEQIRTSLRRYQGRLGPGRDGPGGGGRPRAPRLGRLPPRTAPAAAGVGLASGERWPRSSSSADGWSPRSDGGPSRGRPSRSRAGSRSSASGSGRSCSSPASPTSGSIAKGSGRAWSRPCEEETEERATPLPLDRVVRWRRVHALAALAAVPVAPAGRSRRSRSPEWRIAIQRAVLVERPYTTIEVMPGNVLVDQGEDVPVAVEVKGRPRKLVVLETRPVGKADAPWKSGSSDATGKGATPDREATVEKVKDPIEYRVVAGPAESPTFAIRVRYPLAIKDFEVKVTPPAYTGLDPKTTKGGDVQAVEGSVADLQDRLRRRRRARRRWRWPTRPAKAPKKGEPAPSPTVILPLRREGDALVATLDLTKDLDYKVVARTADGRVLPKNKYRIDVREDRAPRVVFDEPDEALEVHPIAEVRHRARVDDDFGLTRAGIVFRFNDGEEKTLILKDFPLAKGKKPKTSATPGGDAPDGDAGRDAAGQRHLLRLRRGQLPRHPEADRDRPPLHRPPRLQARVQAGRARAPATATRSS